MKCGWAIRNAVCSARLAAPRFRGFTSLNFRKIGFFDCRSPVESVNGGVMFIRFISGEIDEDSRVSAGLFGFLCAAADAPRIVQDFLY